MAVKNTKTGDKKIANENKTIKKIKKNVQVTSTKLIFDNRYYERGQVFGVTEEEYATLQKTGGIKVVK